MNILSFQYISELKAILDNFPHKQFERFIEALMDAYDQDKRIFVMGNGGSAATASHLATDLGKGPFSIGLKRFKILSLNDNISTMLAYANDLSYADIFVEQLINLFVPGDLVIGISGSGNSVKVLKAIEYANNYDGITVGFCGFSGGKLYSMVDIPLLIKTDDMQKVEDIHLVVAHMTMQRAFETISQNYLSKNIKPMPYEAQVELRRFS
ncbi:Sugar isomerase (SIS) [uncultured Desulfobacterium sp.]|uniref:Sugar isomerase (SIS) n=1 Tax=uncultured Desulfobacterium sp. TaxID=201089 RepID=A0A445N406_9BACT|nr:Sugar isomerase (SIS) [uncultured Desulfobacterium sp.]